MSLDKSANDEWVRGFTEPELHITYFDPNYILLNDIPKRLKVVGSIQRMYAAFEQSQKGTTPKDRYRALNQLCRLSDAVSKIVPIEIRQGNTIYVAKCEPFGEYRLPKLESC